MSLNNQFQFAEMNVRHTGNGERTLALVRRAVRMGYDVVVVNVDIGEMNETIQAVSREGPVLSPERDLSCLENWNLA